MIIGNKALCEADYAVAERALRRARRAARAAGAAGDLRLPYIDGIEGMLAVFQGDHRRAATAFCDELRRAQGYGFDRMLCEGSWGSRPSWP